MYKIEKSLKHKFKQKTINSDCGNLVSKMEMSGEYPLYATLYYYDLRNRLSHVSKSGSIADFISYTLDSRGRRTGLYLSQ